MVDFGEYNFIDCNLGFYSIESINKTYLTISEQESNGLSRSS